MTFHEITLFHQFFEYPWRYFGGIQGFIKYWWKQWIICIGNERQSQCFCWPVGYCFNRWFPKLSALLLFLAKFSFSIKGRLSNQIILTPTQKRIWFKCSYASWTQYRYQWKKDYQNYLFLILDLHINHKNTVNIGGPSHFIAIVSCGHPATGNTCCSFLFEVLFLDT